MKKIIVIGVIALFIIVGFQPAFANNIMENHPPEAPTIRGKWLIHEPGTYDYKFKAIDPDGDDIKYLIDWGDSPDKEWTDYYPSGEEIIVSHSWDKMGTPLIRVRANDTYGALGPWGTLEPRDKSTNNVLFRLLERFPLLQKMLLFIK